MSYLKASFFEKMNYLGREKIPFIFIIDFEVENPLIFLKKDLTNSKNILYNINGHTNQSHISCNYKKDDFSLKKKPLSYARFGQSFNEVKREFINGNTYLLNLTFSTEVEFKNLEIDLIDVYNVSQAKYKLYFDDRFVVFSPEGFVTIRDGIISTFPMKGTIKAGLFAREKLINDEKELSEHTTVVDLLRNDIGIISKKVWVESFRYVEKIKTADGCLYATSSKICGILCDNYRANLGEIFYNLLPAGSVSGAPKPKTLEIIRRVEKRPRGYYCGVFGFFDGENLESAVMIRYIEKNGGKYYYKSGVGLTIYSNPLKEYNEVKSKIYVPIY
ncbi:MAG: aminodeoxychorismate synthase component I [Brevinematia bacterium]